MLELSFPVSSPQSIPVDHGYSLYGAISTLLPSVHGDNGISIHPIRGRNIGERQLALQAWSRITFRIPDAEIRQFLPLAGKQLRIGPAIVRVGVPSVQLLTADSVLRSRLVVIKVANIDAKGLTPEIFVQAARKQLCGLGIFDQAVLSIPSRPARDDATTPEPRRRTLRVKDREIVGYEVILEGLTAEETLVVQEQGLGGKRHMGCGVFVPLAKEVD